MDSIRCSCGTRIDLPEGFTGIEARCPVCGEMRSVSHVASLPARRPREVSKRFYLGSVVGVPIVTLSISLLTFARARDYGNEMAVLFAGILLVAGMIYSVVLAAILLHRLWSAIPSPYARTTPAKAIGLCFVPLFNFYWIYQAVWGWTVDFDRFVREARLPVPPMRRGAALAYCILTPIAAIPLVDLLVIPVQLTLWTIFLSRAIDGVNAFARLPEEWRPSEGAVAGEVAGAGEVPVGTRFWAAWTGASAGGGLCYGIVWTFCHGSPFFADALRALTVGLLQWLLLLTVSRRLGWWWWTTVVGSFVGSFCIRVIWISFDWDPGGWGFGILAFSIQGATVGLFQALALRRFTRRAFLWVPVVALCAIPEFLAYQAVTGIPFTHYYLDAMFVGAWLTTLNAFCGETVLGMLGGAALAFWILRPPRIGAEVESPPAPVVR